jgi:hypothetical protein
MHLRFFMALFALALLACVLPAAAQSTQTPRAYLPLLRSPAASPFSFQASAATYLGTSAADSLSGSAIAADGILMVAGTLPNYAPSGVSPLPLLGGGDGAVVRLRADGRTVISLTRTPPISDMALAADGSIVICGSFGIAMLNAEASAVAWTAAPGNATRCDIGSDGTAAALVGRTVTLYTNTGAANGSFTASGSTAYDLAVDGANQRVVVGGYTQDDGGSCGPLQIAFLRAYSYNGTQAWAAYNWNKSQVGGVNLCADTRTRVVSMGADGKIYAAGSINGGTGASIYARDPFDLNANTGSRTVSIDDFTNPFNTGSVSMVYVGRYDPANGALLLGQSLLTRRPSDNKGNSLGVKALAADASGRLVIVGEAVCCIKDRDRREVAGTLVGPYSGSEAHMLALSADFRTRLAWTIFTGPTDANSFHNSALNAVAIGGGQVFAVGTLNNTNQANNSGQFPRSRLLTHNALQAAPASLNATEGYAVLWKLQ